MNPKSNAPTSWPAKPAEIKKPICGGASFQSGTSTGSTLAIASASNASKKVATPTMMRALTCHHDVGRRSSRATTSAVDGRASILISFRGAALACSRGRQSQQADSVVAGDVGADVIRQRDTVHEMRGLA